MGGCHLLCTGTPVVVLQPLWTKQVIHLLLKVKHTQVRREQRQYDVVGLTLEVGLLRVSNASRTRLNIALAVSSSIPEWSSLSGWFFTAACARVR